jgi:hypothetical protein
VETQIGRKPPLLLSLSSMIIIKKTFYNNVLVQTHTSTQASTCRRLQPSLVYQPFLEGSFNPLKIAPVSTGRMLLLKGLTLILTADHVSLIFTLDQAVSSCGYDSYRNYLKSKHRSTDCQAVTKGHILNNSINLVMMLLISCLLNPQQRSLCQCRSAAQLPQGGSSFFKSSMLPAQMTSPASSYPFCQKMASASCKRTSATYHSPPLPLLPAPVGRASTPSYTHWSRTRSTLIGSHIYYPEEIRPLFLKFELNLSAPFRIGFRHSIC